jgi:hypothetical protein
MMRFQRVEYIAKYHVFPSELCAFSAEDTAK